MRMFVWLARKILSWHGVPFDHDLLQTIPKEEQERMQTEAQTIQSTYYWKWLLQDLELLVERKTFQGSADMQKFGMGMLYAIDMITRNCNQMATGRLPMKDSPKKSNMRRFYGQTKEARIEKNPEDANNAE